MPRIGERTVSTVQRHQSNKATFFQCLYHFSLVRIGSNQYSHSASASRYVVTMQKVWCEPVSTEVWANVFSMPQM